MPRKPRFYLPNVPVHVTQRGNNRQVIFFDETDYKMYLEWVKIAAEKYGCRIHAYVLMTNHVHFLITPEHQDSLSRFFQYVGRYYVTYVNNTYGRTGTLWEGRYKASIVDEIQYLLSCYRYIELNPVRAGMVTGPEDYQWSSYQCNASINDDPLVTPHHLYLKLGDNEESRKKNYRDLFRTSFDGGELDEVRGCLQSGTPLGNDRFKDQIEQALKIKVGQTKRGRPRQNKL